MPRRPSAPGPETPDPGFERASDGASRRDALWLIAQQIHEVTADLAGNAAKTERLIGDVSGLTEQVWKLRQAVALAKGFGIATCLLVPASAALLWWFLGAQLSEVRDDLYHRSAASDAGAVQPHQSQAARP